MFDSYESCSFKKTTVILEKREEDGGFQGHMGMKGGEGTWGVEVHGGRGGTISQVLNCPIFSAYDPISGTYSTTNMSPMSKYCTDDKRIKSFLKMSRMPGLVLASTAN